MRRALIGLMTLGFLVAMGKVAFAEDMKMDMSVQTSAPVSSNAVNVGNKICPVSGDEAGGKMGPAVPIEYQGKIYNLCCSGCVAEFNKNPDKYVKKVEEELKAEKEK